MASHVYNLNDKVTDLNETLSGTSFAKFDYGYDNLNRRTYEQRNGTTGDVYSYDYVSQVTNVAYDATAPASSSSGADRTVAYSLDSNGNRTSVNDSTLSGATSYTPNNLNQYTSVGGISYGYDGNGNLISGNGTFIYDAQNRLLTAEVGANTDQYSYDSKNRVVEREINGTPTFFIYDGWNLIEERDSSGDVLATYVMGVRQDEIVSKTTPSGTVYYHHNVQGSVTALTNPSGTVVERYKYDVYGKASITDGSGSPLSASAYGNRFMFTGREYLAEVNLYDYRNRIYSADLGRFLQIDPERFDAGDVNMYRYCGNNPVNATDAMGECPDVNPDSYSMDNPPPQLDSTMSDFLNGINPTSSDPNAEMDAIVNAANQSIADASAMVMGTDESLEPNDGPGPDALILNLAVAAMAPELGPEELETSSMWDTSQGLKGINTNVTGDEFTANLQANGFKATTSTGTNGPVTVLQDGQGSTYTVYTRTSTGDTGAQYVGRDGQVLKYNLGQPRTK